MENVVRRNREREREREGEGSEIRVSEGQISLTNLTPCLTNDPVRYREIYVFRMMCRVIQDDQERADAQAGCSASLVRCSCDQPVWLVC